MNEEHYCEQATVKQNDCRGQAKPQESSGKYPEMELRLAANIRYMRSLGVPGETWMIEFEVKLILHNLFPQLCPSLEVNDDPRHSR